MPRKRQTGNRKRKIWRKGLPATWSRKAHRRVKLEKITKKEYEQN